jgi:hypothetical protein
MATFGDALAALDDFRSNLISEQMNAPRPKAQAMAFRASAGLAGESPFRNVHATGVGVRGNTDKSGPDDFVIKVYMFDKADIQAAAAEPFLSASLQGVEIDVEYLPVQVAFGKAKKTKAVKPAAVGGAAQHQARRRCFVRRGPGDSGPLFVLSNNHVLADVNQFPLGTQFTQPFSANPADVIAALSDFEPLRFPAPGSQPRNVIDAAIAGVTDENAVVLGRMLNIANYTPQLLAPRPGLAVTKAGRTTGVTSGTIRATRVRGVQVNYGTRQNPIIATFDNAITITGAGGVPFSNPGDSGSVILEKQSGRPVALLFAGDGATTTACDVAAACARFNVRPV